MSATLPEYPIMLESLVFEDLQDSQEVMVTNNADGSSLSLNLIATTVLELCDGQHNVADMAQIICETLDADFDIVSKDVRAIIEEFAAFGLLQHGE